MNNNRMILLIIIFALFTSSYAQEIKIEYSNEKFSKVKIFRLVENDTIFINENKPKYYQLKEFTNKTIFIEWNNKIFKFEKLNEGVRGVFIDFNPNSENNCYVMHSLFNDAIQTSNYIDLDNCSAITNIYLFRDLEFDINKASSIKFRKK